MKNFKKIISKLREFTAYNLITKIIISAIFISIIEIIFSKSAFNTPEFFNDISFVSHISMIFIIFLVLIIISKTKIYTTLEPYILICLSLTIFIVTNAIINDFYFALISTIIMAAITFCYGDNLKSLFVSKKATKVICIILGVLFVVFLSSLTILNYLHHSAATYDFGIFSQMFHYMDKTLIPYTTVERDRLLSHFAVHFSPILYILLPFYKILPNPSILLFMQVLIIALGLIPLYKLCKHFKYSNKIIIALSLIYILYPSLIGGCFFYFHENKILITLLLWLFYFIEKGNFKLIALFALLVMLVKEDAAVYIGIIGLYLLFSKKKNIKGLYLIIASVIYFVVVTTLMKIYGEGIMSGRYENYIFNNEGSLITVIINIIKNPTYLFYQLLSLEKLKFLIYMFVPMAMLPIAIKKPSNIILLFPLVLINIMTNYSYQYNIGYQYTYGSTAFLFYLVILNIKELPNQLIKKLLIIGVSSSMIFFVATYYKKNLINQYINNKDTKQIIDEGLKLIPSNKSIKASTFFVASLWNYEKLYDIEYTDKKTDYIVLDLRYDTNKYDVKDYKNENYIEIYYYNDIIAIYKLIETDLNM